MYGQDYCADRPDDYLIDIGNGLGTDGYGLCEGDCDADTDCTGDLVCFQRSNYTEVPGCDGTGRWSTDYCIDES